MLRGRHQVVGSASGRASRTWATIEIMRDTVGLRELRQEASELVRRAEGGEEITVTVAGRPAAVIVPFSRRRWRTGREIAAFTGAPTGPNWHDEHADWSTTVDDAVTDPWTR